MGEFSGILQYFQSVYAHSIGVLFNPSNVLSIWPLFAAFAIAFLVLYFRLKKHADNRPVNVRLIMRAMFPKRVFLHHSAIVDYMIFLINNGFLFFLTISIVATPVLMAEGIVSLANSVGFPIVESSQSLLEKAAFTVVILLVWDFSGTYSHYLKHKVPFLWEFHKVHHSAEVMTPITAMRRHPVDRWFSTMVRLGFVGPTIGMWYLIVGNGIQPATLFGIWAGVYMWHLLGYNLRHSHVWISYGDFWNRIFVSPAQHQVHHSVEPEHYDKNFGIIFSFWDNFLGTLYLPAHDERVKFGLEEQDMEQFRTLRGIYWTPFVKGARLIGKAIRKPLRS